MTKPRWRVMRTAPRNGSLVALNVNGRCAFARWGHTRDFREGWFEPDYSDTVTGYLSEKPFYKPEVPDTGIFGWWPVPEPKNKPYGIRLRDRIALAAARRRELTR